jgi:hypothetical protein
MGTKAGVGASHHRNPTRAAQEAVAQATAAMGGGQADFVFLFASVGYHQPTLVRAVYNAAGGAPLCGCSGEGVIVRDQADESNFSVSVMTIRSDDIRFYNGVTSGLKADSEAVGRTIASDLRPHLPPDTIALFAFPDGLTCNYDRLMMGLEQELSDERQLPVVGGFAGDNWSIEQTYQYCNGEVVSDGVAWALLSGSARLLSNVNHGCIPVGTERTITRAKGNVIYEIDHTPVLKVLEEYMTDSEMENWGEAASTLSLAFKTPSSFEGYDEFMVRYIPLRDVEAGSITIPTEITEGTKVWTTRRDYERMMQGVNQMADHMLHQLGDNTPKLAFQFDCAGRGAAIFQDEQKINLVTALQRRIGGDVPWIGFYTYGELGPVSGHNCFHNYTVVLVVLW